MSLTREEKETIILFNEADDTAECFTYSGRLTTRLDKLCGERGDECAQVKDNGEGGRTYNFPKSWIRVNPPRRYTEEQRAAMTERLRSYYD